MKKGLEFIVLASAIALSTPVFAQESTYTRQTTVEHTAPVPETTYRKTVETSSGTTGDTVVDVTSDKPDSVTKKTVVSETNSDGDQKRIMTKQTTNADGTMVHEEYHSHQNY